MGHLGFGYKEVIEYLGGTTVKCALTGKEIDITKDKYEVDHFIPISRGGTGDLENFRITTVEANQSKGDMLIEEYLELCKLVLENFGYKVEPPQNK